MMSFVDIPIYLSVKNLDIFSTFLHVRHPFMSFVDIFLYLRGINMDIPLPIFRSSTLEMSFVDIFLYLNAENVDIFSLIFHGIHPSNCRNGDRFSMLGYVSL